MNRIKQPNIGILKPKMGVLAIEKRKHPRFNVELPLDYSRFDGKDNFGGMIANASEGGLLAYLPERIEMGALLKIEIFYIKGLELDTIKAVVKVVWCDLCARASWGEHRYGLQFEYIEENDLNHLNNVLKEIKK